MTRINPVLWGGGSTVTNLNTSKTNTTAYGGIQLDTPKTSGKWYTEITINSATLTIFAVGVHQSGITMGASTVYGYYSNEFAYRSTGNKLNSNSPTSNGVAYGSAYKVGDTIGILLDMDNKKVGFSLNGVYQGDAFTGLPSSVTIGIKNYDIHNCDINTGFYPFAYSIPSGYLPYDNSNRYFNDHLKTNIADMKIGDVIPCNYVASTSNTVGNFSQLGVYSNGQIPMTGTATPNGLFYFIKADKGLLIADRVIQQSIKWDTLNSGRFIEGKPTIFNKCVNGTPISGGDYSGYYRENAFDNSNLTYWGSFQTQPSLNGAYIGYDFGLITNINCFSYLNLTANSDHTPSKIDLMYSNDNTNWNLVGTFTVDKTKNAIDQIFTFNEINCRYVKIIPNTYDLNVSGYAWFVTDLRFGTYIVNIRSLSGGCAYVDANENSSTTDKSLGAFPTINEWDKYIVNSDLMGKITKGDNNVWNCYTMYSWCRETPIVAIGVNTLRCSRGYNTSTIKFNPIVSTTATASYGFRPVLEYLESDATASTLFY